MSDLVARHLRDRGVDASRTYVIVDEESGVATFMLFNLTGQLVGYQQYRPNASKKLKNDPLGRYFKHVGSEGSVKKVAVWGLESIKWNDAYCFVVEGIFDAIKLHNAGYPAIAVLTNDPKYIVPWIRAWGKTIIAILDNDSAGKKLSSIADYAYTVKDPYKDVGDMPHDEVERFIKQCLHAVGYV